MNKEDWKQYFTPHRVMLVIIIICLIYLVIYYTIKYDNIKNVIPNVRNVKNDNTIL
jgi:hypothetical protein